VNPAESLTIAGSFDEAPGAIAMGAGALARRRDDLVCHEIDGEAVLYDHALHTTYRLNATCYLVWRLCDGLRDADAIAGEIVRVYGIDPARALVDVESAIAHMTGAGIMTDGSGHGCDGG